MTVSLGPDDAVESADGAALASPKGPAAGLMSSEGSAEGLESSGAGAAACCFETGAEFGGMMCQYLALCCVCLLRSKELSVAIANGIYDELSSWQDSKVKVIGRAEEAKGRRNNAAARDG